MGPGQREERSDVMDGQLRLLGVSVAEATRHVNKALDGGTRSASGSQGGRVVEVADGDGHLLLKQGQVAYVVAGAGLEMGVRL
jgi:hypothetical protein